MVDVTETAGDSARLLEKPRPVGAIWGYWCWPLLPGGLLRVVALRDRQGTAQAGP